ncbi:MAG: hypothetical protein N4A44_00750 [Alphaproteobacteria bacterium]|jgi:hypothetical protein|nr:hypothetical protein [Alphaproteobacteria bacterium]
MRNLLKKSLLFVLVSIFLSAPLLTTSEAAYRTSNRTYQTKAKVAPELVKKCKQHLSKVRNNTNPSVVPLCVYEKRTTVSDKYTELRPFIQKAGMVYKLLLKIVFVYVFGYIVFNVFHMHKDDLKLDKFKNMGIALFALVFGAVALEYFLGEEFSLVDVARNHNYINCTQPNQFYRRCDSDEAGAVFIKKKYLISESGYSLVEYNVKNLDKDSKKNEKYDLSPRTLF